MLPGPNVARQAPRREVKVTKFCQAIRFGIFRGVKMELKDLNVVQKEVTKVYQRLEEALVGNEWLTELIEIKKEIEIQRNGVTIKIKKGPSRSSSNR